MSSRLLAKEYLYDVILILSRMDIYHQNYVYQMDIFNGIVVLARLFGHAHVNVSIDASSFVYRGVAVPRPLPSHLAVGDMSRDEPLPSPLLPREL